MQTFDAALSPAHAARRTRVDPFRQHPIALGRIARVGVGDGLRGDRGLGLAHAAGRLQPAHREYVPGPDQPVSGRHRRAVVEQRRVADHDGRSVLVTRDHVEVGQRFATEERPHRHPVLVRGPHRRAPCRWHPSGHWPVSDGGAARGGAAAGRRRAGAPASGQPGPRHRRGPPARSRDPRSCEPSVRRTRRHHRRASVARPVSSPLPRRLTRRIGRSAVSARVDGLRVEHRVEVVRELLHQLLRHVADDPAPELRHLPGDVQVGAHDDACARRREAFGLGGDLRLPRSRDRRCRGPRP